jgi:hypothetical protein
MKANIGSVDRIIRALFGLVLVLAPFVRLALFAEPVWLWGSVVVGVVLIATASISFCPLYAPFGLSTRKPDGR